MTDLYKTREWQELDKVERAGLLLVIEGLKRGAMVRGTRTDVVLQANIF